MAIERVFKIIKPRNPSVDIINSQDVSGNGALYGNYTWYGNLVHGSENRITKYREYDLMDADIDVSRALDIIAQEMTGNSSKTDLPLELQITAGNEQRIPTKAVTTLKAALRTWCKLQQWDTRLFTSVKTMLKYGDVFFYRPDKKNGRWIYIHAKNVIGAAVSEIDISEVRGWQIRYDNKKVNSNTQATTWFNYNGSLSDQNVQLVDKDKIIRFSLNDDMSEEAPFGVSILRTIYKTFRQKELLEDALIIYRISRAPERRVFYLDVGNTPVTKIAAALENVKNEIRQKKIPTVAGGKPQIDSAYNPLSINEDYFFAVNAKNNQTRVETLPGGTSQGTDELQWFYTQMWKGLRIPLSYVGSTDLSQPYNDGAVGIAYQEEIQFSQYLERLQKHMDAVLDTEFKRFLMDNNIVVDPTIFRIQLPVPTNWSRSRQQKIDNECVNIYNNIKDDESMSKRFSKIKYLQWTQEELSTNERMLREEKGINPDGGMRDLPMIYFPDTAEQQGSDFGGSMSGDGGLGGADGDISDGDLDEEAEGQEADQSTESETDQTTNTSPNNTENQ